MAAEKGVYASPGEPGKRGFEDLECYKLALDVMVRVHAFSKTLPSEERYDLFVQIRRSSKSVTANIAEGYGRYHFLDSLRYYSIARGELNETLAHLISARALNYIDQLGFDVIYRLARQAEKTLSGYMAHVRRLRAGAKEYGDRAAREQEK